MLVVLLSALPARSDIDSIEVGPCRTRSGQTVLLAAGGDDRTAVTVTGPGVDQAVGVDASGVSGLSASISRRQGGSRGSVTLEVRVPAGARDADEGRIRLRHRHGEDAFVVRILAPAVVESIRFQRAPARAEGPGDPPFQLEPSREYVVLVKGRKLADLTLASPGLPNGSVSIQSRGDTQLVLHLKTSERRSEAHLDASSFEAPACGRRVLGDGRERLEFNVR